MKKLPTIAVDLDEVLAPFVPEMLEWHNQIFGTQYQLQQFISYNFVEVWGGSLSDAVKKCDDFHHSRIPELIKPIPGAVSALKLLKERFQLILVTSRPLEHQPFTQTWIDYHLPNVFDEIILCNHWTSHGIAIKKSEVCLQYGAQYLIDDLPQYISDVTNQNINGLLFGNYPWNQTHLDHQLVQRVENWQQVIYYFKSKF